MRLPLAENTNMLRVVITSIAMGEDYSGDIFVAARKIFPNLDRRNLRRILKIYENMGWIKRKLRPSSDGRRSIERSALGLQYELTESSKKLLSARRYRTDWRLHNLRIRYVAVEGKLDDDMFKGRSWKDCGHRNYVCEIKGAKVFAYPTKNSIEVMPIYDFYGKDAVALGGMAYRYCDNIATELQQTLGASFNLRLRFEQGQPTSGEIAQPNPNLDVWTYGLNVRWLKSWVDHSASVAELEFKIADLDKIQDVDKIPQRIKALYETVCGPSWWSEWYPAPDKRN